MRIEHWLPCGADGRAGGRAVYGHVITKFSGMGSFTYPRCSAGGLRPPVLRYDEYVAGLELTGLCISPVHFIPKKQTYTLNYLHLASTLKKSCVRLND